jgi:hypothetical protein
MEKSNSKNGVSVRAYQGDAMTLLAFDLAESKKENFTGFTVRIIPGTGAPYFMTNLLGYPTAVLTKNNIHPIKRTAPNSRRSKNFDGSMCPRPFVRSRRPFSGTTITK